MSTHGLISSNKLKVYKHQKGFCGNNNQRLLKSTSVYFINILDLVSLNNSKQNIGSYKRWNY